MYGRNGRYLARHKKNTPSPKTSPWTRAFAGLAAVLSALLVAGTLTVVPAAFAAEEQGALKVTKTVNSAKDVITKPGAEINYNLNAGCDDRFCSNAELTDKLPAEFAGFEIVGLSGEDRNILTLTGCEVGGVVGESCVLSVKYHDDFDGEPQRAGIAAGNSHSVNLVLKAPSNLTPDWAYNGVKVPNTAVLAADNAKTVQDTANVTIKIEAKPGVTPGKTWTQPSANYKPGAQSTISLSAQNSSNLSAASLSIQDPSAASADAAALSENNPFSVVDFVGFGPVVLAEGATLVAVDAYVYNAQSNTWGWVEGTPGAASEIALPGGVTADQVGGIRVRQLGNDGSIVPNATATVDLIVAQRATNRIDNASIAEGTSLTNVASATSTYPKHDPVTKDAEAPYATVAVKPAVQTGKTFETNKIAGGTTTTATISGVNRTNGAVDTLTVSDRDFFTAELAFGGFDGGIHFPAGATNGEITWYLLDGTTSTVALVSGENPETPAGVSGFDLTFTGAIEAGGYVNATFGVAPAAGYTTANDPRLEKGKKGLTNTVTATVTAGDKTATAKDTDDLEVVKPELTVAIDKKISPNSESRPVAPGGRVNVGFEATAQSNGSVIRPKTIVVEDSWAKNDASSFWDAFNPVAISLTQVLPQSVLTVEYFDGTAWTQLTTKTAGESPELFRFDIPAELRGTIQGLRYTFESTSEDGYAAGTIVAPGAVFEARPTLRSDSKTPTSVAAKDPKPTKYNNVATADASGEFKGIELNADQAKDADQAYIATPLYEGTGPSPHASKRWHDDVLPSQSGSHSQTDLGWSVYESGFTKVVISDPASKEKTPKDTVFQAFDLFGINPITVNDDPNMRWDLVTAVELYDIEAGKWTLVPAPEGTWMDGNGFVGYTLSETERANTTGVRVTVEPNDAAREAATTADAPLAGSGIATTTVGGHRSLVLDWKLRNTVRVPAVAGTTGWVEQNTEFNTGSAGSIDNTVKVTGTIDGKDTSDTASDVIGLRNLEPAVNIDKTVSHLNGEGAGSRIGVTVPNQEDAGAAEFPVIEYSIKAINNSRSNASYVRVSDPVLCSDAKDCLTKASEPTANVFDGAVYAAGSNPFEYESLTALRFTTNGMEQQIDRDVSQVTLWLYTAPGKAEKVRTVSITEAEALSAEDLADVVGVSVVYQGTDPATNGGSIETGQIASDRNVMTMDFSTVLRTHQRTSGAVIDGKNKKTIENMAQTQSYDPVLFPNARPNANDEASVVLTEGHLDIAVAKDVSPNVIEEKDRENPVTVRMDANQGDSTAPTTRVTIADATPSFWNSFELIEFLPGNVKFPEGADRVRVDINVNGALDEKGKTVWTEGTFGPTAVLPTEDLGSVTGIRLIFTADSGRTFSTGPIPAKWSASVLFSTRLLETTRDGSPITFNAKMTNEVHAESIRPNYPTATDDAEDAVETRPGKFSIDVSKTPKKQTVQVGANNEWTLTFTNTGNGYLNVTELLDTMPEMLAWDGVDPKFSTTGTLATEGIETGFNPETNQLRFAWPEGGNRMKPGEVFTVKLNIVLNPGLGNGEVATNQMVVTTAQELASCTNQAPQGQGTVPGLAENQCGTTNFVQPEPGNQFFNYKGVIGEVEKAAEDKLVHGAVNVRAADRACKADAEGFFRSPCAANTVVGGTDEWKLQTVNTGTSNISSLTIVDALPTPGDQLLATGGPRKSTFRSVLDGAYGVQAKSIPEGTSFTWEVTTDARACIGGGEDTIWSGDATCAANTWASSESYSGDWADVTAIRVNLDFAGVAGGHLTPGKGINLRFKTINTPASEANPQGAPVEAPVADAIGWNQMGVQATFQDGTLQKLAPIEAGVIIKTGALAAEKTITGEAAALYAPQLSGVEMTCRVPTGILDADGAMTFQALTLPEGGSYELNEGNGLKTRVPGLPLGATCDAVETGDAGHFGETTREGGRTDITILDPETNVLEPVALTNFYEFAELKIAKRVSLDEGVSHPDFGAFSFSLQCRAAVSGTPVLFGEEGASSLEFTLAENEEKVISEVPAGATCELTETDAAGAQSTTVIANGENADSEEGTTARFALRNGVDEDGAVLGNQVEVSNRYEAGTLQVFKNLAGEGAKDFGTGPFTASVTCSYDGQELYSNGALPLVAGEPVDVPGSYPYGTVCDVEEVATGGANSTENPAQIVISEPVTRADITNYFEVGSLELLKKREGSGVAAFGQDTYTAAVSCTWDRDGESMTVALPDAGIVQLGPDNDYRATLEGILKGATCVVEETEAGLATATAYSPKDGTVTILGAEEDPARVTITNTFDTGKLEIEKTAASEMVAIDAPIEYTITVRNTGEIEAVDTPVSDHLPNGATVVSAPGATEKDGELTWVLDSLKPGQEKKFSVTVTYAAAGAFTNCASVTDPTGPWSPTEVKNPGQDPTKSCVTVAVPPAPVTEPGEENPGNGNPTPGGGLVATGTDLAPIGLLALLLLLSGAAVMLVQRRRSEWSAN